MADPPGGEVGGKGGRWRQVPRSRGPPGRRGPGPLQRPRGLRGLGSPRLVTGARRFPPASGVTSASATEQGLTWAAAVSHHTRHTLDSLLASYARRTVDRAGRVTCASAPPGRRPHSPASLAVACAWPAGGRLAPTSG